MSSYTLTQFATQAARDLGCLRAGQELSADIISDVLTAANQMLDAWLIDELMIVASPSQLFQLIAGAQYYLIGPNAVQTVIDGTTYYPLVAERPINIDDANIILNTFSPVLRTPLNLINVDQWADIRVQAIPYAIPLELYYERGYDSTGSSRLMMWPGPLDAYQMEFFAWNQSVLKAFPDATTAYSYPPGYARLIRKQLAVEIAPLMTMHSKAARANHVLAPSEQMLALVQEQARQAKEAVQSYNADDPILVGDPAYRGGQGRTGFNYLIGTNARWGR